MDPITRTKKSQKVTIVGAIVDFLLSFFKVIVGVIGNSGALVADGVHSFSDLLTYSFKSVTLRINYKNYHYKIK